MCGRARGGGSLVLRLPSESIYLSGRGAERERDGKRTAAWTALAEEEFFNMLSFLLVPTQGGINSTDVCTSLG